MPFHNTVDDAGKPVRIEERESHIPMRTLDNPGGNMKGLSSWFGPDGEQLTGDGDWFRGIHSGRRYKRP